MKIPASRQRRNEKGAASTSRSAHAGKIFTLGLAAGIACAIVLPAMGQGILKAMDREAAFYEARMTAHLARLSAEMRQEEKPLFAIEETRHIK